MEKSLKGNSRLLIGFVDQVINSGLPCGNATNLADVARIRPSLEVAWCGLRQNQKSLPEVPKLTTEHQGLRS
jgi:hypothetical protein